MTNVKVKEEGKVKSWFKRHKTALLAVGLGSVVGVVVASVSYNRGYSDGLKKATITVLEDIADEVVEG